MFKKIGFGKKSKKGEETVAAEPGPTPPQQPAVPTPTPPQQPAVPTPPAPAPPPPQAAPAPVAPPAPAAAPDPPSPPLPNPPRAKIHPPPAPVPPPPLQTPHARHTVDSAPVKAATIVSGQGVSEDEKVTTTVPGGVPAPEYAVARSGLAKEDQFRDEKPLQVIRDLVEVCPAGLLGSLVGDIQYLSYAYMDVNFLQALQAADQAKKGLAQGAVAHALGTALQTELAAYQKEKYAPRGVTCYKNMQWGQTANEFYVTTHAEMLDGHNSRTGSWTARWKIDAQNIPGVNVAEMSGAVETRSWCYEDCTAHMLSSQKFDPVTVQGDEENPLARVIKNQIVAWEKEMIEALNTVYGNEMDGTLKAIRRTLPITRTRLKWELISNRAIKNRDLKKK